jgi:hypothetical protein
VDGAGSYVVEVCGDPQCGRLAYRAQAIEATEHQSAQLEVGSYYWRVTAVSASGLDGYPSTASAFAILSTGEDDEPPSIRARFTGTQHGRDGVLYLGPGARLETEITDEGSGVERGWATLDGVVQTLEAVAGEWEAGEHEVVIHASDKSGNTGHSEALRFVYDPIPPEIHWGPESGGVYHSFLGEQAPIAGPGSGSKAPRLKWSRDRTAWQPISDRQWSVTRREAPRFYLRSGGRATKIWAQPNVSMPLKKRRGVGVLAHDTLAGTESLVFRLDTTEAGSRLVVEAVDWLGNRSSASWPVARGRGSGSR